ncbi:MAG: 30S ribosomal protein S16 [Candidatus Aminicenantes bacterium]|nr:30S ribosomal protein S16 [Candidatus Aminicenantes bacterium]
MLSMRLMRFGTNKKPFYRIVVMEARSSRQSRPKDFIGNYNPLSDPASFELDLDKAKSWLAKGAKPSQTVQSLLERASQRKKLSD